MVWFVNLLGCPFHLPMVLTLFIILVNLQVTKCGMDMEQRKVNFYCTDKTFSGLKLNYLIKKWHVKKIRIKVLNED